MDDKEVARWAGFYAPADPTTAVAVAIAEHGGGEVNPSATHTNDDGSIDSGIWQINSVHQQRHPTWTVQALKDPQTNAEAMRVVSSGGTNWQPWSTYKTGKHRAYMERAKTARDAVSGTGGLGAAADAAADVATDPLGAIADLSGAIGGFFEWLTDPNTWRRVALVGLGAAVAVVGVAIIARGTEVGQTVERIATGAAGAVATKGASGGASR